MNNKTIYHLHLSLTKGEAEEFKKYCSENGIVAAQLVRRLIMQEIKNKSTITDPNYVPPKVEECLIASRR